MPSGLSKVSWYKTISLDYKIKWINFQMDNTTPLYYVLWRKTLQHNQSVCSVV